MSIAALEIAEKHVALVTAKAAGRGVEILRSSSVAVEADGVAAALRKLSSPERRVILMIARSQAILREFEIPEGTPEEVIQMVRFQVGKELPLPQEQIAYSFVENGRESGKIRIQVAAVPNQILTPALETLASEGFKVDAVTVSTFGLVQWAGSEEGAVAVVGMAGGAAEILVAERGAVGFSHSASVRDEVPTEEFLSTEIHRAVLAYNARAGKAVSRILVASDREDLVQGVQKRLGREVFGLRTDGSIARAPGVTLPLALAPLAGICLEAARGGPKLDLLHPPTPPKRIRISKAYRISILTALVALLAFVASRRVLSDREKQLKGLKTQLTQLQSEVTSVKQKQANTRFAGPWRRGTRFPWATFFSDVTAIVRTEDLYISSATFEESGSVVLAGKARSREVYEKFRDELRKLPYLKDIEFSALSSGGKPPYDNGFTLSAKVAREK